MQQQFTTLGEKSGQMLDGAQFSRDSLIHCEKMVHMREEFWRGINLIPYLQIERSLELLNAIQEENSAQQVFVRTTTSNNRGGEEMLSYLKAYKKPLEFHLEELKRSPNPALNRVLAVILNEFPRLPEKALIVGGDVQRRWERWEGVERALIGLHGSIDNAFQRSDPLGIELLGFERDFGGTREECEELVHGLLRARDQYVASRDAILEEKVKVLSVSAANCNRGIYNRDVPPEEYVKLLSAIERCEPEVG